MGFKEVMAFRQNGEIEKALAMALEDFNEKADQWSASALFWVLRDLVSTHIEEGRTEEAKECVDKMKEMIPLMGPTANMGEETLERLEKEIIPHYNELKKLTQGLKEERNRYLRRELLAQGYEQIREWQKGGKVDTRLHEPIADIVIRYIEQKKNLLTEEEYREGLDLFTGLEYPRPSELHNRALELALEAKKMHRRAFSLLDFVQKWDVQACMTDQLWQRPDYKHATSPAEQTLHELVLEDLDLQRDTVSPETLYLLEEAERRLGDDLGVELTKARVLHIEQKREEAVELYEQVLVKVTHEARSWYEYAELIEDKVLKRSAYAKALKMEADDYEDYLLDLRLHFAELLIDEGKYSHALRELEIYAQLSGEKSRPVDPYYTELTKKIPKKTEAEESNKDFYYTASREIDEYIFRNIESTPMVVMDVMAIKVRYPQKMIMPMIKLRAVDGRFSLVSTRETGILPGDNRGRLYSVKLVDLPGQPLRSALVTPSDEDPKELFPTEYGYITGYHTEMRAFHVLTAHSRHHYLPGNPDDYSVGDFVNYILFLEKTADGMREYLVLPEKADPDKALAKYPIVRAVVAQVYDDQVFVVTDDGHQGSFPVSMAPYELTAGELCALRGFIFKKKDRESGAVQEHFVTLSMEPLPPELLQN